ncbi:MAG: RagB/SusD family nutrient uptake outer membrane protein [Bacteroidota bacterium]
MKKILIIALAASLAGCHKLDLTDPSNPTSASFYRNQAELELAVNDLYRIDFWGNDNEFFSDNNIYRGFGNAVVNGTLNSEDGTVRNYWLVCYKAIARVNSFLENKDKAASNTPASVMTRLEAEARLIRAYEYSRLIMHFGDVPLITTAIGLEEGYTQSRTPKADVLSFIFSELDFAAANLPLTYTGTQIKRFTKGLAFAIKARTALYMNKWTEAKVASDSVIRLATSGTYSLHSSFAQLFQKEGEASKEIIWSVPKDEKQKIFNGAEGWVKEFIARNAGGYGAYFPSFEAVDAFECTDGLPIDESLLYDRKQPFKNRDPRMTATIVEFGTPWLGFSYQPHPDSINCFSYKSNSMVANNDSRGRAPFASFTGFLWKKGIDQSWADRLVEDNDVLLFRLAEMYLTYAEAKAELGEIDQSALDAINRVRARGYGVAFTDITRYPAVKPGITAADFKKILKRERRVEFMLEGLRYMDLIRWRLAEKALTAPIVGQVDPGPTAPRIDNSKWPFAAVPAIDDDGIANYAGFGTGVKTILLRKFDPTRQYLWPIPAVEVRVNPNMTQNPNY